MQTVHQPFRLLENLKPQLYCCCQQLLLTSLKRHRPRKKSGSILQELGKFRGRQTIGFIRKWQRLSNQEPDCVAQPLILEWSQRRELAAWAPVFAEGLLNVNLEGIVCFGLFQGEGCTERKEWVPYGQGACLGGWASVTGKSNWGEGKEGNRDLEPVFDSVGSWWYISGQGQGRAWLWKPSCIALWNH